MQPTQNTATLAEQPSRCWDSSSESETDRRFFDLRDTGYAGPVDQGGYPAATVDPAKRHPQSVGTVLRSAARYLAAHGWCQGSYCDQTATVFTPAACVVEAIAIVCYGGPVDAPALMYDAPGYLQFSEAVDYFEHFVTVAFGQDVYSFNDARERTALQVQGALLASAAWFNTYGGDRA
jgi:hypothetical protein